MAARKLSLVAMGGGVRREDGTIEVKRRPRPKTIAASRHERSCEETREMLESGEWDDFAPRHLVALHDLMHEKCYGVAPVSSSEERYKAVLFVGSFVKRAFDGSCPEAVEFFRWIWAREMGRHKWRLENGRESRPLGIFFACGSLMLNDYRVATAARAAKRASR